VIGSDRGSSPEINNTGAGGGRFSPATALQGDLTEQHRGSSTAGPERVSVNPIRKAVPQESGAAAPERTGRE